MPLIVLQAMLGLLHILDGGKTIINFIRQLALVFLVLLLVKFFFLFFSSCLSFPSLMFLLLLLLLLLFFVFLSDAKQLERACVSACMTASSCQVAYHNHANMMYVAVTW